MNERDIFRDEMRGVLSEMAAGRHRGEELEQTSLNTDGGVAGRYGGGNMPSASPSRALGASSSDKTHHLRERIAILEDALAKSEADRAAVYARCEHAERALAGANEEKMALLHEFHGSANAVAAGGQNSAEMNAAFNELRIENERLRIQLEEVPRLKDVNKEQEKELKKLRKVKERAMEERTEGVTLSDLHFSNERLSAQLAKLQAPPQSPIFDENKFKECESAILAIANDVTQFETKLVGMQQQHHLEKQQLQEALDRQFHEFSIERAECDRVVGIMSAKLEALVSENAMLKKQGSSGTAAVAAVPSTSRATASRVNSRR